MKKMLFIAAWLGLLTCFFAWLTDYEERFAQIESRYGKAAVNLNGKTDRNLLATVLANNNYAENDEDARFIADFLVDRLTDDRQPEIPEAVLDLQKRKWQIPAEHIEQEGTPSFRKRLDEVRRQTGWSKAIDSLYHKRYIPSSIDIYEGTEPAMKVYVYEPVPDEQLNIWRKFTGKRRTPVKGVVVRLQRLTLKDSQVTSVPVGYACTDAEGKVVFRGLAADHSYSVLPVSEKYSYGNEKGTFLGTWEQHVQKDKRVYEFLAAPMTVRPFSTAQLVDMRDDGAVTVRTPQEFKDAVTRYMTAFLVAWMLVFIAGNVRGRRMDPILATAIMLCSGLSMLLMFGINDPLTERVLGYEMAQAAIAGAVIIFLLMSVDFKRFFRNRYWMKFDIFRWAVKGLAKGLGKCLDFLGAWRVTQPLGRWWGANPKRARLSRTVIAIFRKIDDIPAVGYLMFALSLSILLWLFGSEVGGMKVNLNIGVSVQPSEIIKFSFLVFVAAFLFEKGDRMVAYSEPVGSGQSRSPWKNLAKKVKTMAVMLMAMGCLMTLYMLNSDMGPALVVVLTFIILYSMVKSRIAIDHNNHTSGLLLLQSDLSMLFIGVTTYGIALVGGYLLFGFSGMEMAGILWLVAWLAVGWLNGKRLYETPLMFNLVIYFFVFGAHFLESCGALDIAGRLAERNALCVNTWGTLGGEPAINTQVAEGLWALAGGGMTGLGLDNAMAHYIPAYHTDMILQSIGEILGFVGMAAVIVLISVLLKRTIVAGYRSGHLFLLYLCSGIAIVTGIQLFIIAFGSMGLIPLTGISVPFFSFGRVGLIMTVMAFGVPLSISARNNAVKSTQTRSDRNTSYNLTVGMLTLAYTLLAVLWMAWVAHYQMGEGRDTTLVRPVYAYDTGGAAVVKYNPRITYLTSRMKAGSIYDRNGILLATSDTGKMLDKRQMDTYRRLGIHDVPELADKMQQRYYPLGGHTFFMVGDANRKYYFSSVDNEPFGYLAEARHLSEMRGYDNRLMDAQGRQMTADLVSHKYRHHRFLPPEHWTMEDVQLRDYSPLLPFLKQGRNGALLASYNAGQPDEDGQTVRPKDIRLTLDAELQVRLQNGIPKSVNKWLFNTGYRNYERYSIVVMDAVNGDLLASANYPLPDSDCIETMLEDKVQSYNDNNRQAGWKAYTERDLGLTFMTKPGSTAKVVSALAGLMEMETTGYGKAKPFDCTYTVYRDERIHTGAGAEPPGTGYSAKVGLTQAIGESSNCYFINLVNDRDLYDELAQLYGRAGHRVGYDNMGRKAFAVPYKMEPADEIPHGFIQAVTAPAAKATGAYRNYIAQRDSPGGKPRRMIGEGTMAAEEWMWAWGEGSLDATPAAMARVAATAATGLMPRTRFRMTDPVRRDTMVTDRRNLELLRNAMKKEASERGGSNAIKDANVGGKTGTPERLFTNDSIRFIQQKAGKKETFHKKNDGWYIAFIDNANTPGDTSGEKGKLAVAVRIERTMSSGSGYAKRMMKETVLPVLRQMGYIE